jgi:hypothetical protein
MEKLINRVITIREDQDSFLKNHREINFSAWVRKKIDDELL